MKLEGTYTAMVTPFRGSGIDIDAYRKLLEKQALAGVSGVVPCGSTGEAATMSGPERDELLSVTLETVGDKLQVIPGTGTNSTATTIELTRRAEAAGAHAAMIVAPYYNKPTQEGLLNHFCWVADATSLPLVVYNVPSRTAVTIAPRTIAALHKTGRYVALKEAGGSIDAVSDIRAACDMTVLSGDDSLTTSMMALGARGVISVISNVYPVLVREMVESALAGDYTSASRNHFQLLPVIRAAFVESNPAPVKAMLAIKGWIDGSVRPPLAGLSTSAAATVRKAMDTMSEAQNV